ncbi:hypothetical protein HNY73_013797 [Argiope bruennichi]|uniref:Uncharacterized protein n=1 Tax=Argiope bruennichi TaxID=94029 RepID=A0A8T0ER53_ARGBR|nr:hypothetical protein HNY73_013797 [Argiope bruennichi]
MLRNSSSGRQLTNEYLQDQVRRERQRNEMTPVGCDNPKQADNEHQQREGESRTLTEDFDTIAPPNQQVVQNRDATRHITSQQRTLRTCTGFIVRRTVSLRHEAENRSSTSTCITVVQMNKGTMKRKKRHRRSRTSAGRHKEEWHRTASQEWEGQEAARLNPEAGSE